MSQRAERTKRQWSGGGGRTQGPRRGHCGVTSLSIVLTLAAISTVSTSGIATWHACQLPRALPAASTALSAAGKRLFLRGGSSSADAVWASAVDAGSGRTYYYNVKTKEVAWVLPPGATLRPPRTAGTSASTAAGASAGGGGPTAASATVESVTAAAKPAISVAQPQQAPSAAVGAHEGTDEGTQTSSDACVTVHPPPVLAQVEPGFGRKTADPAQAPDVAAAAHGQPWTAGTGTHSPGAVGTGNHSPGAIPGAAGPGGEFFAAAAAQSPAAVAQQTSSTAQGAPESAVAAASGNRPKLSSDSLWKEQVDPGSGRVYYFHSITRESVWELPNVCQIDEESSLTKFFSRLKTTAGKGKGFRVEVSRLRFRVKGLGFRQTFLRCKYIHALASLRALFRVQGFEFVHGVCLCSHACFERASVDILSQHTSACMCVCVCVRACVCVVYVCVCCVCVCVCS